jgi:hypothetical protein
LGEKELRQAARGMYKTAEQMKMLRLAQEGTLAQYLLKKEFSKMQRKMNAKVRKALGIK